VTCGFGIRARPVVAEERPHDPDRLRPVRRRPARRDRGGRERAPA